MVILKYAFYIFIWVIFASVIKVMIDKALKKETIEEFKEHTFQGKLSIIAEFMMNVTGLFIICSLITYAYKSTIAGNAPLIVQITLVFCLFFSVSGFLLNRKKQENK